MLRQGQEQQIPTIYRYLAIINIQYLMPSAKSIYVKNGATISFHGSLSVVQTSQNIPVEITNAIKRFWRARNAGFNDKMAIRYLEKPFESPMISEPDLPPCSELAINTQ